MTHLQIVFGGQGGQGVRLISTLLGKACAAAGRQVASSASYGPEVRGTYTRSEVIVSDEMIVYPRVLCPDILVALSQEAYDRVSGGVSPDGVILYEAEAVTPARDVQTRQIPVNAIELSSKLGSAASANMVMLGVVVAVTAVVTTSIVKEMLPERRRAQNEQALDCGYALLSAGASFQIDHASQ
jgi:2-oxoglutarate ferredoxin oxidoreductase subunit gamma